ncbi:MAG: hypothetical protein V4496_05065 [Pseudomonadota bacterium]
MIKNSRWMLLIASLLLVLTASLLWFRISLNSDSLFLEGVARDLFDLGGQWSDWRMSPAPAYVPDMMLYFLSYKIFPHTIDRIFFVSVMQVFLLALAIIWASKQIYPQISIRALALEIVILAFVTLVSAHSNMWLYFYSTNNHFASLLFALICSGLVIRYYAKPSIIVAILLVFFAAIAIASTVIFIASFLAPAILLAVLMLIVAANTTFRELKIKVGRVVGILVLLVSSFFAYRIINAIITFNEPLKHRVPRTIHSASLSFEFFLQGFKSAFNLSNGFTFFLSSFIAVAFIFLCVRFLRVIRFQGNGVSVSSSAHWRLALSCVFLCVVLPVNISGVILSGGYGDISGYRYFTFPLTLILILAVIMLDSRAFFSSKKWTSSFVFITIVLVYFSILVFKTHHVKQQPPSEAIVRCIVDLIKKDVLLQEGVSDYWNARGVSEFLPNKNAIIVVNSNNLMPRFWMSTIGPMHRFSTYHYYYNFAILRETKMDAKDEYTPDIFGKTLPMPSAVYKCSDANAEIWYYGNNHLDAALEPVFKRFMLNHKNK